LESDILPADHPGDRSAYDDLSAGDHSRNLALFADDYLSSLNVTFNFTVYLQHASADNPEALANDPKIVPDHRLLAT
jgi:hypothetical protein